MYLIFLFKEFPMDLSTFSVADGTARLRTGYTMGPDVIMNPRKATVPRAL